MTGSANSPFRLFKPPLATAAEYAGAGPCDLCGEMAEGLLELGIGADVIYSCLCGAEFAVSADEHDDRAASCPGCGAAVAMIELSKEPATCISCLERGRAALTKDTEYGMVRWEDAVLGRTHGRPGLHDVVQGFALLPPTEGGWVPVQAPAAVMLELVRTPSYSSWQGEQWLFCCAQAMIFVGDWAQSDFVAEHPSDPLDGFLRIVEGAQPWMWENVSPAGGVSNCEWGFYVFRCGSCGKARGHYDMS